MNDDLCRQFFVQPQVPLHRRYEALRAYFLDGQPLPTSPARFGYRLSSLKSLVCRFRFSCRHGSPAPFFSPTDADDLLADDPLKKPPAPNDRAARTSDA